jgi:EpsI family protein
MRFWTTLLFMMSALGAYAITLRRNPDILAAPLGSIAGRIDGWAQTAERSFEPGVLNVLKPTSYLSRTYTKDGQELDLFTAYYAEQRAGESMHSPKNCLPGAGWEIWKLDSAILPARQGRVKVNKYSVQRGGDRMQVLYWYQSKRRILASESLAKILLIKDTLVEGHRAGAIVRIVAPDRPEIEASLLTFAGGVANEVQRCLGD